MQWYKIVDVEMMRTLFVGLALRPSTNEFNDEKQYIYDFSYFSFVNDLSIWMLRENIPTRISYSYSLCN